MTVKRIKSNLSNLSESTSHKKLWRSVGTNRVTAAEQCTFFHFGLAAAELVLSCVVIQHSSPVTNICLLLCFFTAVTALCFCVLMIHVLPGLDVNAWEWFQLLSKYVEPIEASNKFI